MLGTITQATQQAAALQAQGRLEEAIALHRQIVRAFPTNAVALQNLAGALGNAGYAAEAETQVRRAFAKGLDAPETWLILARACQGLGKLDESEAAFREVLKRRPIADAFRDLAQLRWMRGADIGAALAELDTALQAAPNDSELIKTKALVLAQSGHHRAALDVLLPAAQVAANGAAFATLIAQSALEVADPALALTYARRAVTLAPNAIASYAVLVEALLAYGDAMQANTVAQDFRRRAPLDQHALALQALAWRALGDPRYGQLYDYDSFVHVTELARPAGWPSLDAYLKELAHALHQAHHFHTHPFAQSIRHGTQASSILRLPDRAIRALPEALDAPIKAFLTQLGQGGDPLRARNTGGYAFQGMWSIRMQAGGRHINHVHPKGWLSSACYVEVPEAANTQGHEGWLKFGEPNVAAQPPLGPEKHVQPAPGRLVLFPSYMWHGTVPFTGGDTRLTFAFDLTPA